MRGNRASYEDPNDHYGDDHYGDELGDEYDELDDLVDDERLESARRRAQQRGYRPAYGKPGRRPAAEREGAFNALMWMLDGTTGMLEELRHSDLGLSEDFWVHAYAARRESLMALRAILNDWIDEETPPASPAAKPDQPKQRRGGIDIDF